MMGAAGEEPPGAGRLLRLGQIDRELQIHAPSRDDALLERDQLRSWGAGGSRCLQIRGHIRTMAGVGGKDAGAGGINRGHVAALFTMAIMPGSPAATRNIACAKTYDVRAP
jgi:hypothetical protein